MKRIKIIVASLAAVVVVISSLGWAVANHVTAASNDFAASIRTPEQNNPILTNGFTADPYAIEYNGRVYVYMTNDNQEYEYTKDQASNSYGHIKSIRIISSDDMVNWTDHGNFEIAGINGVCKWAGVSWAPAVAHKKINGKEKFFLYFTSGGYQIGVATSDSPIGPFKDELGKALLGPYNATSNDNNADTSSVLDPAVMIDDDGTGYITYGAGGDTRIAKLGADMMSLADKPVKIDAPYMFEDSGINKIGNKYYYSYCSDWKSRNDDYKSLSQCAIAYMMADSPTGPYKYTGQILPNAGEVFEDASNNHHCIINFKGKYYMFYHTMVLDRKSRPKVNGYRSCHVNEITVNPDGTLNQVNQDLIGVKQIKYFNPYETTSGTTFCDSAGVNNLHGFNVYTEAIKSNSYKYAWTYIKGADFGSISPKSLTAKLRLSENCTFRVCLDSVDGPEIAKTTIKSNSENLFTVSIPVEKVTGVHNIYFEFDGNVKDFVSWQFKTTSPSSPSVIKEAVETRDIVIPKIEKVKAKSTSSKELSVTWKEIRGAKYKVAYSTSKRLLEKISNGDTLPVFSVNIDDASTNKFIIKKTGFNSTYYIKVCAYKKTGNNLVIGDWSSIITVNK